MAGDNIDAQLNQVKSIYEEGVATINNHDYTFTKMTFTERRKVFSYLTTIKDDLAVGNFGFLDSKVFKEDIEKVIFRNITLDGMTLSKKNPFDDDEYMCDYVALITNALAVISYPFSKGGSGE